MSLDLHDIERSVGADLLRRPLITASINAALLRIYVENILTASSDEDEDVEVSPHIFADNPLKAGMPRGSSTVKRVSAASDDADEAESALRPASFVQNLLAALLYLLTTFLCVVGLAETVMWVVFAVLFKLMHLPRVYAFEKLVLDVRALFLPHMVRHIEKTMRYHIPRDGPPIAPLVADRRGLGPLCITFVQAANELTRDTSATLRLFRYATKFPAAYWAEDAVTLAGRHASFLESIVAQSDKPGDAFRVELGWHVDVIEETTYKIAVEFTREQTRQPVPGDGNMSSPVRWVSKRVVQVDLALEASTESLELVVKSMDQFAAACEASERGTRAFNGKRLSIYAIGLLISVMLVVFYEGTQGLVKPSSDVLTLAVGAFTLWMTLGRSAALGETEEETMLKVQARENILLSYHGLAHISENVVHTCWVPETLRAEPTDGVLEAAEVQDGSITLTEAAVCLSIFNHFGHLVKWKGPKLKLYRIRLQMTGDKGVLDVGHVMAVDRVPSLQALPFVSVTKGLLKLGGSRCKPCEEEACRMREEREARALEEEERQKAKEAEREKAREMRRGGAKNEGNTDDTVKTTHVE